MCHPSRWLGTTLAHLVGSGCDHVPRNYGDVVTIIGALTVDRLTVMMTVRGGTTEEVFRAYREQVLAPELRDGDVFPPPAGCWDSSRPE